MGAVFADDSIDEGVVDVAEDGDRWVYLCKFLNGDDGRSKGGAGSSEVGVGFDAHELE